MAAYGAPGRAEIARAIPSGSRRLRSRSIERQYLDALTAWPDLAELRADARRNVLEFAKWLARSASYADGTTWHSREYRCQLAGACVSTWKAVRRRLEAWGFLGTVRAGTAQRFSRPMALADPDAPGEAAVYVLCVPRATPAAPSNRITRPPTGSRSELVPRPARARPGRAGPASRPGSLPAVVALERLGARQGISDGWRGHLAGPFAAAGWTAADVAHAVDYGPSGAQHRFSAGVRHPTGWLRWRLAQWLGPAGDGVPWGRRPPVPSRSQQLQASRDAARAEREQLRADLARAQAARVPPAGPAARIRAAMGWPRPERKTLVRWIQYANENDHQQRVNGRPREATEWRGGPGPGLFWVIPADLAVREYVLIHRFPTAPEENYALDTEQDTAGAPAAGR